VSVPAARPDPNPPGDRLSDKRQWSAHRGSHPSHVPVPGTATYVPVRAAADPVRPASRPVRTNVSVSGDIRQPSAYALRLRRLDGRRSESAEILRRPANPIQPRRSKTRL
ncbi:unnamed protein product, partial [Nesidiocoris tenuis]